METNLNFRIPDDLHRALKIHAAEEGVTLKELIIRLLTEGLRGEVETSRVDDLGAHVIPVDEPGEYRIVRLLTEGLK